MALHDADILMFNQFSADKKPGMGVMEHIKDRFIYQELCKIQDWRKMLSNEFLDNLVIDERSWLSVDHYVLTYNYKDDPSIYTKLQNIKDVKELSKLKKRTYQEDVLEKALTTKFSIDKFKAILIETKDAIITHWKRGMDVLVNDNDERYVEPNTTCQILMKIRSTIEVPIEKNVQHVSKTEDTDISEKEVPYQEVVVENTQNKQFELKILSKKDFDDFDGFISKYDHECNKSVNVLTKYEKTNIIGVRMEQLSMGCETYIQNDLAVSLGCVKKIALAEFEQRRIPYIICRSMPNNTKEYWKLADLICVE